MAQMWQNVLLAAVNENGQFTAKHDRAISIAIEKTGSGAKISVLGDGIDKNAHSLYVISTTDVARLGRQGIIITNENEADSTLIKFQSESDCRKAKSLLAEYSTEQVKSTFTERTDKDSATQYFQFYSYLSQQQNMMQDYIRTETYQRSMLSNVSDFANKVVLDVGAGSGILSFFAVQAGAKKVYAVEASNMAKFCQQLVQHNGLADKITVLSAKIEEVELPEQVDTIISEPIGYMLFNERMIETYLHAKKFLKPGGKMFPTQGHLFVAPFTDDALYQEQATKSNFWCQQSFHGVNLTALRMEADKEIFKQPVVDTFNIASCMAPANKCPVDFLAINEQDLYVIDVPLKFNMTMTGNLHGLAFWFDLAFIGSSATIWLSTSPTEPLTHWYQVRCLLRNPVFVKQGQVIGARLTMRANSRQSYDVEISVDIPGSNGSQKSSNVLDLKNPYFRYGGQVPAAPAVSSDTSPTDQLYASNGYQTNIVNMNGNASMTTQLSGVPPINPGSIPSVGSQHGVANRTSIGGGLAPSSFAQPAQASAQMGVSNQYMIGDYAAGAANLCIRH